MEFDSKCPPKITSRLISPGTLPTAGTSVNFGWKTTGYVQKVAFSIQPAISLKPSGLESQSFVYRVSIETRVRHISIGDKSVDLGWTLAYFFGDEIFSTTDISHTFLSERDEIWQCYKLLWGLANQNLFPEFREVWSWGSVWCINMRRHASVLHWYTCKVVFDNFHMFADSFSVLFIHCVVRGLGASFLYKCPASRGGSLRQHGILVKDCQSNMQMLRIPVRSSFE